jgi:hypothetical protein
MRYWVYENWTAEKKAVVHAAGCGNCKDGRGCHQIVRGSRNGRWLGPFNTLVDAQAAANATGRPSREHSCI